MYVEMKNLSQISIKEQILDLDKRIFKTLEGIYLETREQHVNYLLSKGIII